MEERKEKKGQGRLGEILSPDHPLILALAWIFDMAVLSIWVVLLCAPVITAGAAFCAMHVTLFRRISGKGDESLGGFLKAFKENFVPATCVWLFLILEALAAALAVKTGVLPVNTVSVSAVLFLFLLETGVLVFLFPVIGRYQNTLSGNVKLAVQMALYYLPVTAQAVGLFAGFLILCRLLPVRIGVLILIMGVAPVEWLSARLTTPAMRKLEKMKAEEEEYDA